MSDLRNGLSMKIISRPLSKQGQDNWDRIFGKVKKNEKETKKDKEAILVDATEWTDHFDHVSSVLNSDNKKNNGPKTNS